MKMFLFIKILYNKFKKKKKIEKYFFKKQFRSFSAYVFDIFLIKFF